MKEKQLNDNERQLEEKEKEIKIIEKITSSIEETTKITEKTIIYLKWVVGILTGTIIIHIISLIF